MQFESDTLNDTCEGELASTLIATFYFMLNANSLLADGESVDEDGKVHGAKSEAREASEYISYINDVIDWSIDWSSDLQTKQNVSSETEKRYAAELLGLMYEHDGRNEDKRDNLCNYFSLFSRDAEDEEKIRTIGRTFIQKLCDKFEQEQYSQSATSNA